MSRKYLGLLTQQLETIKSALTKKMERMEAIDMSEIQKMWALKGENGETVNMDLSWVASHEDIENLIDVLDDLRALTTEMSYGDVASLAETCISDWGNISVYSSDKTKAQVYSYKGNKTNIVIPSKIKCGSNGILNTYLYLNSGATTSDNKILGQAGVTKRIAFIGDFVDSPKGYFTDMYAEEFINLEKATGCSVSFSYLSNALKIHSTGLKSIDYSKMAVQYNSYTENVHVDLYGYYTSYKPTEQFFLFTVLDTPNLETVILPEAAKEAIDNLINSDYDLMGKMKEHYPNFKEFLYK